MAFEITLSMQFCIYPALLFDWFFIIILIFALSA